MKATAINFYVRDVNGDCSQLLNAREEISRGKNDYGVEWRFEKVDREKFIDEVNKNKMICCIETKSGKFIEIDKNNIDKFII